MGCCYFWRYSDVSSSARLDTRARARRRDAEAERSKARTAVVKEAHASLAACMAEVWMEEVNEEVCMGMCARGGVNGKVRLERCEW